MSKNLRKSLSKAKLKHLYLKQKKSLEDIGRLYGVSRVAVWKYCNSNGISRRTRSEARQEAEKGEKVPQNYYQINDMFFSKWSRDMAYILGLIATDGCISKTGNVSFRINDKTLLEKVRSALDLAHGIKKSKYQGKIYSFYVTRKKISTELNYLGIFPRKSTNIKFPYVPDAFLADFIRGVFDGDGSVYFNKSDKTKPMRASFVSSSRDFIVVLEQKLKKLGLPGRPVYAYRAKNGQSFTLRYMYKDSIALAQILYRNVPKNGLYLERKRKRFITGSIGGLYEFSN